MSTVSTWSSRVCAVMILPLVAAATERKNSHRAARHADSLRVISPACPTTTAMPYSSAALATNDAARSLCGPDAWSNVATTTAHSFSFRTAAAASSSVIESIPPETASTALPRFGSARNTRAWTPDVATLSFFNRRNGSFLWNRMVR